MTDPEQQEVLERLDDHIVGLEALRDHPIVEGFAAEDYVDEAVEQLYAALQDVREAE